MTTIALELGLLFILLVLNGVFAMTEIAVVSSRKNRLRARAEAGDAGAVAALALAESPNQFLSTVQIGITLIGIFAGAFGGATLAAELATGFEAIPFLAPVATEAAFIVVVALLTFFTLVIGELVPKRIGLLHPEALASTAARPMRTLATAMRPIVALLSISTDGLLRLAGIKPTADSGVSEEEVTGLVREGMRTGVFLPSEGPMVEGVLALDRVRVREIMTPRPSMTWLEADATHDENWRKIVASHRSRFPVCDGSPDHILGIVTVKSLYANLAAEAPAALRDLVTEPLYVSELQSAAHLLEDLKRSHRQFALVTDEFGTISGLVTLNDLTEAIVGDLPELGRTTETRVHRREDGSYLVAGLVDLDELADVLPALAASLDDDLRSDTVGGFICELLGRVPNEGDIVTVADHHFEVVDMDRLRVDKILVTPPSLPPET